MTTQLDCSLGLSVAETTYGTPVTPTKFFEFTEESLDWSPTFLQGEGLRVGSRVVRSARRSQGKQMVAGDITVEAASKGLGAFLKAAFGQVTTTQRGTTGVYQQVHTPTSTDSLDSYTIQKGVPLLGGGAAQPHTFRGMMCDNIEFDCPNGDIVSVKTSWNGRDVDTTAMSYSAPSYPTPVELFTFTGGAITVGGTVTAPTATALATGGTSVADISDWNLTWDNQLDDGGFNLGAGGKRARKPATGMAVISGSMTAEFDATTLRDAYLGQLDLAMVLTFQSLGTIGTPSTDHAALQLVVRDIRLEGELPKIGGGDVKTQSINYTGFDDLSGNAPITVVYASTDSAP